MKPLEIPKSAKSTAIAGDLQSKNPQKSGERQANCHQSSGKVVRGSDYCNLAEAARYIGCSTRFMRRHWPDLVRDGVLCFRVPKGSVKGRLVFAKASLDAYLRSCQVQAGFPLK